VKVGATTYSTSTLSETATVLGKISTSSGLIRWSRNYRATSTADAPTLSATGLAVTSSDRIMMSGSFHRDANFGKGTVVGGDYATAFLTRFYQ
jgi:hypothetical protein